MKEQPYITIVGRTDPPCMYCNLAKRLADRKGVSYTLIELSESPEYQAVLAGLGVKSIPAIFLDDEYLGGWKEFFNYV